MTTAISVLVALASVVMIVSVVLQEGEQAGLGSLDGSSPSDSWGQNRGTSRKEQLKRVTTMTAVVFFVAAIALAAVQ
ncbi:MAG: preprotein translocase subunit SecG [Tissierellia bacterium]|nr:preprotein translocase subunit SecG [Tissierellia bacterium]